MTESVTANKATGRTAQPTIEKPVQVRELTKQFGDEVVVDHVSFDVLPGSVFGFIGPSGSGKTTTLRMLTGIYHPTSGEIKVLGHAPRDFTRRDRERIGYMPQHFVLYPDLTVWENLNFAASIYGIGFGRRKRMRYLLEFVELLEHHNKRVSQISGGMQRRLSLATTLIHEPRLLFLDEPTTGLDPVLRKKLWDYFQSLKANGITIFVTTQYVSDASYCDTVGMMNEGRLIALDSPTALRRKALGGDVVILRSTEQIGYQHILSLVRLPFVRHAEHYGDREVRITVDNAPVAIPELVQWSKNTSIQVESIQEFQPPYDDIFVSLIRKEQQSA